MAHGGARPGAGRPKGSTSRPSISDYWTEQDIAAYFDHLKKSYKTDSRLAVFVGEHIMGKAVQPLSGLDGNAIQIDVTIQQKARQARGAVMDK